MKLAVVTCLALFVAVCSAMDNQETIELIKRLLASKGLEKKTPEFKHVQTIKSTELMSKMRKLKTSKTKMLSHKHLESHCENAYVELEDTNGEVEEGMFIYPKEFADILFSPTGSQVKKGGAGACTFHITSDEHHQIFVYVAMEYVGDVPPTCGEKGLGELSFHLGDSVTSPHLGSACGEFEYAFIAHGQEIFVNYTPATPDNVQFFVYYEIVSKKEIVESVDHGEDEPTGPTGLPHGSTGATHDAPGAHQPDQAPPARRHF